MVIWELVGGTEGTNSPTSPPSPPRNLRLSSAHSIETMKMTSPRLWHILPRLAPRGFGLLLYRQR